MLRRTGSLASSRYCNTLPGTDAFVAGSFSCKPHALVASDVQGISLCLCHILAVSGQVNAQLEAHVWTAALKDVFQMHNP